MASSVVFPFAHPVRGRRSKRALAPRVSPAAVRVPDPRLTQIELTFPAGHPHIFVHEGARQALERRLGQAYQRPVLLSVTDNRRHMIALSHEGGVVRARVHHMFLDAPVTVQESLVEFVTRGDRDASLVVGRYIEDNGFRIRASRRVQGALRTQGSVHDLYAIFQRVNEHYFGGRLDALITWGRRGRRDGKSRRTIKLGSYSAVERLIRIHPSLDRKWVPRYFIAYVVYHEMLHHLIPSSRGGERKLLHPPVFQAKERMFRDFERALAWERAHIGRLLRT
jgi:hypothetical protein